MAEPIKIIITQGGVGGEGLGGDLLSKGRDTAFGTEADKLQIGFTKKEQAAFAGLVLAASRKYIMNTINNTANMTGNYMETTRIREAIEIGTKVVGYSVAGIGIAGLVSAGAMSGPFAVVAVGAVVLNEGMNFAQKIKNFDIQVSKQNWQAERARMRAGTSLGDGSRGTNG